MTPQELHDFAESMRNNLVRLCELVARMAHDNVQDKYEFEALSIGDDVRDAHNQMEGM